MTTDTKKLRELLAEAIGLKMAGAPEHGKYYRKEADAALATFRTWLAENGLVVVPREATDDMEVAGTEDWLCERAMEDRALACWKAMIAAAPTGLEDSEAP
jgi:hypothetical protein